MIIISRGGEGEDDISVDECIGGVEDHASAEEV